MKKIIKEENLINIIVFVVIIISMFYVPSIFIKYISKIPFFSDNISSILSILLYSIILILIFYKDLKKEFKLFLKNFKNNVDTGFKYWTLCLLIVFVSNIIINIIIFRGSVSANESLNRESMLSNPVYTMISAVLFAPIIEELIFRKSARKAFKNKYVYIIVSSFLFGFAHTLADLSSLLNLLYIIPYGVLGLGFAIMDYKTNTTFTSIVMHMIHNLVTYLLLFMIL